jgi:hypothetical protein
MEGEDGAMLDIFDVDDLLGNSFFFRLFDVMTFKEEEVTTFFCGCCCCATIYILCLIRMFIHVVVTYLFASCFFLTFFVMITIYNWLFSSWHHPIFLIIVFKYFFVFIILCIIVIFSILFIITCNSNIS